MPCIDLNLRRMRALAALGALAVVGGCSTRMPPDTPSRSAAAPAPAPAPVASARAPLPRPSSNARDWAEYRLRAAQRVMAANPNGTYTGPVPQPSLAIPVLEIELNADGSVRRINVLREPSQATDTIQLAMDAVRRAAPFGDVSRLPKPWKFTETFLFDDDRRFKPMILDR